MTKPSKEERLKTIVRKGLEHLQDKLDYGQSTVVNKLGMLEYKVSTSSFSNIKNDKSVGLPTLSLAAKGIQVLMERELDMAFDADKLDYYVRRTLDWVADVIPESPESPTESTGFKLHADGRVSLQQKTAFFAGATKEVIEVGVRLNSFASYFFSQNEKAYKEPIIDLLRRGVNVKGYLLDPESQEARIYFEDRARVQATEKDSISEIKKVIERLRTQCTEFERMQLKGKFEIYLYRHIPYNLFFVIDGGEKEGAKMMVSPYLYGVRRANCPVMEFTKKDNPPLYRSYWESMQLFIADARKLE